MPVFLKNNYLIISIVLVSTILIFKNLSNMYLWQDEACVAVLGRNVLKFGYPNYYDGKNILSNSWDVYLETHDYKNAPVRIQTWLEYYLLALSFLIFGINTFSARLPFALLGLASVILSYFFFLKVTNNKIISRISIILLIFSVPFLLHVRQVNYYALLIFLSIWVFYSYVKFLKSEKYASLHFVASNAFLFHSFLALTPLILLTILIHFILNGYIRNNSLRKQLLLNLILIFIFVSPFLFMNPFARVKSDLTKNLFEALVKFKSNLLWINNYMFPFLLVFMLGIKKIFQSERIFFRKLFLTLIFSFNFFILFYFLLGYTINLFLFLSLCLLESILIFRVNIRRMHNLLRNSEYLILFSVFVLILLSALSIASEAPFFRYLVPLIPLCCLFAGIIVCSLFRSKLMLSLVTILLVASNVFAVIPIYFFNNIFQRNNWFIRSFSEGIYRDLSQIKFKSDIFNYFWEITHDYDCPVEGIVKYLIKHAGPLDVVKISYNDMPLMFYTDLRVISWRDRGGNAPDWIIPVANVPLLFNKESAESIKGIKYRKIFIDYPNICYSNLPDPLYHNFWTVRNKAMSVYFNFTEAKEVPRVVLYQKLKSQ